MKNNIILKDIPKDTIQIDIWPFEIRGGFRGFQQVPNGLHYISARFKNKYPGIWCFIEDSTIVKIFNSETAQFNDVDTETTKHFQQMADGGFMDKNLIIYPKNAQLQWFRLTSHITSKNYNQFKDLNPPSLCSNINNQQIIAAYQMAFLRVIVCHPKFLDPYDMQIWKEWILAFYNAEKTIIDIRVELFITIIDLLILHQKLIEKVYDSELIFIRKRAKKFVNKLLAIGDSKLSQKAKQYQFFLF